MRRIVLIHCLLALTLSPLAAQEAGGPAATGAEAGGAPAVTQAAPLPSAPRSGLPQTAPPPRTLRAYWHLFGAYAIVWTLLFGYAVYLGRRSGALERKIERLEGGTP